MWLDARRKHIESLHIVMIAVQVILNNLHRFELFDAGLLCNLVLAGIGIVLKMAYVGDVSDVSHLVTQMLKIAVEDIEGNRRTGVTQMGVAVHRRTADIHSRVPLVNGLEGLFDAAQRIIDIKGVFHPESSC